MGDPLIYLADSPNAFLSSRPEWTLSDAKLSCMNGREGRMEHRAFHWADGVWEAEVIVHYVNDLKGPDRVLLQVAPTTLRRWSEVGIDPVVEACAQLRDHLRRAKPNELSLLTLL